jgi:UDP-N-acetylglucosamine acyltransferase
VPRIDSTARVEDGARVADDVEVGPFCTVGPQVELRAGVRLLGHVSVSGVTVVGERTVLHPFASIGSAPQSLGYRGEPTRLIVGADCVVRESVTMNTGTADGRGLTEVGDRGYFMAYSHVGHDCRVGNDVIFANGATLGGHCVIGDHVFIGGLAALHQFTHVGGNAMISGVAGVRSDIIPFATAAGVFARLRGINAVGMRRRKFSSESIRAVRTAYRMLFSAEKDLAYRLADVEEKLGTDPAVGQIVTFVRQRRKRPLCHPRSGSDDE